jgi:hypothetical protein
VTLCAEREDARKTEQTKTPTTENTLLIMLDLVPNGCDRSRILQAASVVNIWPRISARQAAAPKQNHIPQNRMAACPSWVLALLFEKLIATIKVVGRAASASAVR